MGSGARQPHRDQRRQRSEASTGRGLGIRSTGQAQPRAAPRPPKAGAMRKAIDEVGRSRTGNRPLSFDARGRRRRELTGDERVAEHAVASLPIAEAVEALREKERRSLDRALGKARARHGRVDPGVKKASSDFGRVEGRAPALSATTGKGIWPQGLDRRRRRRGRPIPGGHLPMTEVSVPSSSGEIVRVAQGRVRKGTKERETQRSPWRGVTTGRGAVPGTELSTLLGCRVPKGARRNITRIGGTHLCLVGR
jgi:hypothetical protein